MKLIDIKEIEKELLARIPPDSPTQVEKVERYLKLVQVGRDMYEQIEEEGMFIEQQNGPNQYFKKANPLIGEMLRVDASLLKLENSFELQERRRAEDEQKQIKAVNLL